ncbi:MAG: hypothetical protein ABIC40_03570, partial [bacterium]
MKSKSILALLLPVIILLMGCSGSDPATPSVSDTQPIVRAPVYDSGRTIWGIWEIAVDPVSLTSEIVPARFGEFHANVRQFLEQTPCTNCLKIVPPIIPTSYGFDVTIQLRHPFPGVSYYTGFDVRGIAMFGGSFEFPNLGLLTTRASNDDYCLLNADGYTRLFNAPEYTQSGMFGYSKGKLLPPTWPNPTNTLNAFKAYYSDGQSEDVGGRRAFFAGDQVNRTYQIKKSDFQALRFWYAVDASWKPPTGTEPYDLSDFGLDANCPEPYRFDFSVVSGELTPGGGSVEIGVDIWDHQGWNQTLGVDYEAPECFDGGMGMAGMPDYVDGDKAHTTIYVMNDLGGLDPDTGTELVLEFLNEDPDPFLGTVLGIGRFTIPVVSGGGIQVYSIDPDSGEPGEYLSPVEIFGSGFQNGCMARLEKMGEPDIDATGVNWISSSYLTCDIDLTGAAIGLWDVTVENPGGATGTLANGFEVLESQGCNDALHYNYLGDGDFGGGTNMPALDACFVHDSGTDADG